ncbi:PAS domain-containing protein [bacterium]|nr:PAS domain-containing protein [candidate division CSSED10-310 bacterium]
MRGWYFKSVLIVIGIAMLFTLYGALLLVLLGHSPMASGSSGDNVVVKFYGTVLSSLHIQKVNVILGGAMVVFIGMVVVYAVLVMRGIQDYLRKKLFNEVHRQIFDHLVEGVLVLEPDGKVTYMNRSAHLLLQTGGSMAGSVFISHLFPGDRHLQHLIGGSLDSGTPIHGRELSISVNSKRKRGLLSMMPLDGLEGGNKRSCVFLWDITELARLQSSIKKRDRLAVLGQLISSITHEIRNPLSAMDMNLQMLAESWRDGTAVDLPRDGGEYISVIRGELNRLNRYLDDFVRFSRRPQLNLIWADPAGLVQSQLDLIRPTARDRRIGIIAHFNDELPLMRCDPNAIKQVLLNIIANAITAMPGGGDLSVQVTHHPMTDSIEIEVADNGEGIDDEILDKIFDVHFTTRPHGSGLGLSIALEIVTEHGGEIDVKSKPGCGSTFRIELPVAGPFVGRETTGYAESHLQPLEKGAGINVGQ